MKYIIFLINYIIKTQEKLQKFIINNDKLLFDKTHSYLKVNSKDN